MICIMCSKNESFDNLVCPECMHPYKYEEIHIIHKLTMGDVIERIEFMVTEGMITIDNAIKLITDDRLSVMIVNDIELDLRDFHLEDSIARANNSINK